MGLHVISLGGSLIVPGEIDSSFLSSFKHLINKRIENGDRFILVAGGGKTARKYQSAAAEVSEIDNEEKDWIGIHATRINAHLLRTVFKRVANPKVIKDYDHDWPEFNESVLVGAGWKPGWSTDYDAVLLAERYGADTVITLTNIDYVYSDDPNKNPDAVKYTDMSWDELEKLIGTEWDPGLSMPFDPIASKKAKDLELKVVIMNGSQLSNLENFLDGNNEFKGTIIK